MDCSKLVCLCIFGTLFGQSWTLWSDTLMCSGCNVAAYTVAGVVRLTGSGAIINNNAPFVCNLLQIDEDICQSYVDSWLETLTFIIRNTEMGTSHMCGLYLPACQTELVRESLAQQISADSAHQRAMYSALPYPPPGINDTLHVLQLADIHYDREYQAGSANTCNYPLCCRKENGFPNDPSVQAGFWGDYSCDTPPVLLNSLFRHLKAQHTSNIDYILWTGDTAPHDSWKTSPDDVIAVTRDLTSRIESIFAGTPVVPVIGNHDTSPINFFPPANLEHHGFSSAWLYEGLAEMWRHWLPPTAIETFRHGGFYELEVKPGLKLLVLNTNLAYSMNLWVLMTATSDIYNQLRWLRERLTRARTSGYRCHILGHISPADSQIIPSWSHAYHEIIYSFRDVVTAQFFSHTHLDEFQLFRDDSGIPFSVSYVSPSISPWKNVNPGYKIFRISNGNHLKYKKWEVVDVERWGIDLAEANLERAKEPNWHRLYTSSQRFDLPDLSPISWDRLLARMTYDDNAFFSYYTGLGGQSRFYDDHCDSTCRWRVLCEAVTTDGGSSRQCDVIKSEHTWTNRMFSSIV